MLTLTLSIAALVGLMALAFALEKYTNTKPVRIPFKELSRHEGNVISLAEFRAKRLVMDARQQEFQGYGHPVIKD